MVQHSSLGCDPHHRKSDPVYPNLISPAPPPSDVNLSGITRGSVPAPKPRTKNGAVAMDSFHPLCPSIIRRSSTGCRPPSPEQRVRRTLTSSVGPGPTIGAASLRHRAKRARDVVTRFQNATQRTQTTTRVVCVAGSKVDMASQSGRAHYVIAREGRAKAADWLTSRLAQKCETSVCLTWRRRLGVLGDECS